MSIVPTSIRLRALSYVTLLLASLSIALVPACLTAQPPALPSPVGYVNDFAGVLSAESKARLEDLALRLNSATRGDMVVVTLSDLGDRPVEEVALRLGREWKIGDDAAIGAQARNAGVVILVVPKETASDNRGRCRIEVGQGAEGFITDATAGSLCREAVPLFSAGDYTGAIEYLALTVADRYAAEFGVTLDGQPRQAPRSAPESGGGGSRFLTLLIIIVVIIVLSSRGRGRGGCIPIPIVMGSSSGGFGGGGFGGGFGGGGGGGGFGGFGGGGGFSGGGGGSDW